MNYRVAGVCRLDGCVLTSKNRNEDFYALLPSKIALYLINHPSSVRRILHIARISTAGGPV